MAVPAVRSPGDDHIRTDATDPPRDVRHDQAVGHTGEIAVRVRQAGGGRKTHAPARLAELAGAPFREGFGPAHRRSGIAVPALLAPGEAEAMDADTLRGV